MTLPEQHAQHTYSRTTKQEHWRPAPQADDVEDEADEDEEDLLFPARVPRSAIRY
jgi:hypothetical protein